jgi:plasmid stability protein
VVVDNRNPLASEEECMQNASMPSITIRDVPEDTRNELARRASESGRSLQQYLRSELISLADRPDNVAIIARMRERLHESGGSISAAQIVEWQREDRGE